MRRSDGVLKRHDYDKHISELKYKILHDRMLSNKEADELSVPPYLRKRNRRYKSIYEAMHENKHEPQNRHFQYQQFVHQNELPNSDQESLTKLLRNSLRPVKDHSKNHHHSKSQHQIKKLRSKPEAGLMQKKLKI